MAQVSEPKKKDYPSKPRGPKPGIKYYLIAYNVVSAIGWSLVLAATVAHLLNLNVQPPPSKLARLFNASRTPSPPRWLPASIHPVFKRACTAYAIGRVGPIVRIVQTGALLEVLHVLMGLVRSPLATTAMQVASRIYLVWGITESFSATRSNPFYASMVLAWSVTEVIRYSFYACNLAGTEPGFLVYLRYTTFYILYPLGASSEAALIYSTLPNSSPLSGTWSPYDLLRGVFFLIWWPGLYVMYTYMIKQRRKVLGGGKARVDSKSRVEILQERKSK
ncbi:3-hydroxy acyl-CoA dehydratase [Ceratobasidium sp. AG-Ba]|nr:3-hydroxy acyl-CoA dehydratase [Ceratobasidium sp. AG-Ba]QRW11549.1 3-hydroxy acyl-CoA dehydratase [Ceratobasidium sp. AG-Ba]